MPQHADPGGNRNDPGQEDPNADGNNENAAPNPPSAPHQGNAGQQQQSTNQQQQNVDQQMPNQGQQQVPAGQYQPGIQGQRQYPHYAQALDPVTGNLIFPRLVPTPMRPLDVAHQSMFNGTGQIYGKRLVTSRASVHYVICRIFAQVVATTV